ncbi:hypothetical protein KO561_10840 [Radiobacillus kanasensis]|uniref:YkyB family protein n=1 Tax=Radiobacillus kanasensis TaxID=2844358 RepID=UPI001E57BB43|nr:YkyB family protein [Radiobacillus kanasensis]UFT97719.1 hypothetical protein KO561_10840 [Radiobacillus kanasensis]
MHKEIPHFHGWSNIPKNYYTKTKLKNEMGRKPLDVKKYDATLKAMAGGKWRHFVLYHIDHTVPIKPRKVDISKFEFSIQHLSEALYRINKHAKKHRDTKQENYYEGNHKIVGAAKTKQLKYYDLKELVLEKLLEENKAAIKGYHKMFDSYYLLIECGNFTFHRPLSQHEIDEFIDLVEIDEKISSEPVKEISINFYEAEKLLEKYIGVTVKQIARNINPLNPHNYLPFYNTDLHYLVICHSSSIMSKKKLSMKSLISRIFPIAIAKSIL